MSLLSKLLALTFVATVAASVTDCSQGKGLFSINSQGFAPEPPVANQNATLWIDYTIPDGVNIDAGTCKYTVSLNGLPFTPTVDDLCTQVECPLTSGTYNLSSTSVWPSGISGKVVTKIEWFDSKNTLLLCSQTSEKV